MLSSITTPLPLAQGNAPSAMAIVRTIFDEPGAKTLSRKIVRRLRSEDQRTNVRSEEVLWEISDVHTVPTTLKKTNGSLVP